jgi:hypothetical protein
MFAKGIILLKENKNYITLFVFNLITTITQQKKTTTKTYKLELF